MKKKLTDRQIQVLAYCSVPRRALEVADHLGILLSSVYPYLANLIRKGLLSSGPSTGQVYKLKTFRTLQLGEATVAKAGSKASTPVEESPTLNMDFIRAAHNPFGLRGAR